MNALFQRCSRASFGPAFLFLILSTLLCIIASFLIRSSRYDLMTGMILLATAAVMGGGVLETAMAIRNCSRDARARYRLLLFTIFALVLGVELFLRFGLQRYATYPEKNGFGYRSMYHPYGSSWFHTHSGTREVRDVKSEFAYSRQVNSLGLCEQEVAVKKKPGEYRVIALGDSFTEGVGTSYESTWVKVLERRLAERMHDQQVVTVNAGISGSDPFYGFILLREWLLPYGPDLLLVAVNPTDVLDVMVRGGMDRFRPDGTTEFARPAPKWEWVYASSYIARHVVHDALGFDWLLLRADHTKRVRKEALGELRSVLEEFQRLSQDRGFALLVIFHPSSYDDALEYGYSNDLGLLITELERETTIEFVDLLDYYAKNRIITETNAREYFWPLDGHHNTEGYRVMGEAVTEAIAGATGIAGARSR